MNVLAPVEHDGHGGGKEWLAYVLRRAGGPKIIKSYMKVFCIR